MKLGINSYTFMGSIGFEGVNPAAPGKAARPTNPLTPLGLLEKAHQFGLRLVQTGPNLGFEKLPVAGVNDFIQKARAWGIDFELGMRGLDETSFGPATRTPETFRASGWNTLEVNDGGLVVSLLPYALACLDRHGV